LSFIGDIGTLQVVAGTATTQPFSVVE